MIIKCKMCGGDIEFNPGDTYGQCDHCGSTSTIPKADDEQKLNRYNRANHFRRQCEFDKAVSAYERILEEDDADAEAHWGAVLSRFGIEYVEDPATKRRIPTCHRVQLESILADVDYLAAIENAPDEESRKLYEEQGKEIAEIQKGILAISSSEEPYDVFICYKETDESGQRTRDSALAQEVYYGLTEQGYKVFFARITLEDKLGQQYEPYIFAALNSARVMVVIGTKPEYFNSVWVKNEWSRYLHLMKNDRKRILIPCYRGMDPYDLPDELSNLQSQDMGKIGFIQDLLRGIRKVLKDDSSSSQKNETSQQVSSAEPNERALLDRAMFALEDGDFQRADEFVEQLLNINARNSQAYVYKLMVERKIRIEANLAKETTDLEKSPNFVKAIRFADDAMKQKLESWAETVKDRIEQQRKASIFQAVQTDYKRAKSKDDYLNIVSRLNAIMPYNGAEPLIERCQKRIDELLHIEKLHEKARQRIKEIDETRQTLIEQAKDHEREINKLNNSISRANDEISQYKGDINRCNLLMANAKGLFNSKRRNELETEIRGLEQKIVKVEEHITELQNIIKRHRAAKIEVPSEMESLYQKALIYYEEGLFYDAVTMMQQIRGYKDVEDLMNGHQIWGYKHKVLIDECRQIGNIVHLGLFDYNVKSEAVEWIVADLKDEKALLVSKNAITSMPFCSSGDNRWDKSEIREWLNAQFLDSCFTEDEKSIILFSENETGDKVFLLDKDEFQKYSAKDSLGETSTLLMRCEPTPYAIRKGIVVFSNIKYCWWWLRGPGEGKARAPIVSSFGLISNELIYKTGGGIRPALWINLQIDKEE